MNANGVRTKGEMVAAHSMTAMLVVFAVAIITALAVTFWPFDVLTKFEITVIGPTHAGQELQVQVDYCKTRDIMPAEVRWALSDGVMMFLAPTMSIVPQGCHVRVIMVPTTPHMTPGRYRLEQTVLYHPLPWRTEIERAISPWFEVVP
jgi:hypothetical protein